MRTAKMLMLRYVRAASLKDKIRNGYMIVGFGVVYTGGGGKRSENRL